MLGQTFMKILGILFWVIAIIILMASYGILSKPVFATGISKGFIQISYEDFMLYNNSLVLSVFFLIIGMFLIFSSSRKKQKS